MQGRTNTAEMKRREAEVVISGLSGRLPESDNIAEFRQHLINGDDMVTEDDRRFEPGEKKTAQRLTEYRIQNHCFHFYARQHICYSAYMLSPVRPSVRLSVTGCIIEKRLKLGLRNFHHTVAPSL